MEAPQHGVDGWSDYGGRNESARQGGGVKSKGAGADDMGRWRPMAVRACGTGRARARALE